jgi:hypothetical protein
MYAHHAALWSTSFDGRDRWLPFYGLCNCAIVFFSIIYNLFNFSATVSYDRKQLLDIRTAITHLVLNEYCFSLTSRTQRIYFRQPTRPTSPSFAGESDGDIGDVGRGAL